MAGAQLFQTVKAGLGMLAGLPGVAKRVEANPPGFALNGPFRSGKLSPPEKANSYK